MSSDKLFLKYNPIDDEWKVVDHDIGVFGSGKSPVSAVESARAVTNRTIYTDERCKCIYNELHYYTMYYNERFGYYIKDNNGVFQTFGDTIEDCLAQASCLLHIRREDVDISGVVE